MKTNSNRTLFLDWTERGFSSRNIISALLKEHGISKSEIARRAGCSTQFVNMVLAGKRTTSPTAQKVQDVISQALGFYPWV